MDAVCADLATRLEEAPPGVFPAGAVVLGRAARWGIGLRCDAVIPHSGRLPMIHWLLAPHADAPLAGIVEDCRSGRLPRVYGGAMAARGGATAWQALDAPAPLPPERAQRRNLIQAGQLMGLRGWDIPHDRHMVVTDLATGLADITGCALAPLWHGSWLMTLRVGGCRLNLAASPERVALSGG